MRENIHLFLAFFDGLWFTQAFLFFPSFLSPVGLDVCCSSAASCEIVFLPSFSILLGALFFTTTSVAREVSFPLLPFGNFCNELLSTQTFSVWFFSFFDVIAPSEVAQFFGRARHADNLVMREAHVSKFTKTNEGLNKTT